MKNTTLCYLEQGGCYLMLHRTKKKQDENAGKWVGVGGKLEPGESPDTCLVREVKEETGFTLHGWRFRGVVSFLSDIYEAEQMFLFTSEDFSGVLHECDEGELAWVEKEKVPGLPLWEGDRVFLRLLAQDAPPFLLTLRYEGQRLVQAVYNGRLLPVPK
ncbi:MAG: NUDIX hydrolase [Ruthenibacterium sp.]|jgi:8-oxo-dGTP diphosphatase